MHFEDDFWVNVYLEGVFQSWFFIIILDAHKCISIIFLDGLFGDFFGFEMFPHYKSCTIYACLCGLTVRTFLGPRANFRSCNVSYSICYAARLSICCALLLHLLLSYAVLPKSMFVALVGVLLITLTATRFSARSSRPFMGISQTSNKIHFAETYHFVLC